MVRLGKISLGMISLGMLLGQCYYFVLQIQCISLFAYIHLKCQLSIFILGLFRNFRRIQIRRTHPSPKFRECEQTPHREKLRQNSASFTQQDTYITQRCKFCLVQHITGGLVLFCSNSITPKNTKKSSILFFQKSQHIFKVYLSTLGIVYRGSPCI